MQRSRAYRRHQVECIKRQVRKRALNLYSPSYPKLEGRDLDITVGWLSQSPQFCSNPSCCGNPRHDWCWPKLTRQELRIEVTEKEFLQEDLSLEMAEV